MHHFFKKKKMGDLLMNVTSCVGLFLKMSITVKSVSAAINLIQAKNLIEK